MLALYYGSGSPYAWRVQLGLEHKALPYERIVLSFTGGDLRTPEHLARNPRGKVPVLVDDGFALYESAAILEYLDEAYPGRGRPLFPGDARARAVQRRVILETNDYLDKASDALVAQALSVEPEAREPEVIAKGRAAVRAELAHLAPALTRDYFCGDEPGAADFTLYTLLGFLRRCQTRLPEVAFEDLVGPAFAAWMTRIDRLPFADACIPPHWKAAS
jgi:glutathione S-transferase